jgi:hypothetical protein
MSEATSPRPGDLDTLIERATSLAHEISTLSIEHERYSSTHRATPTGVASRLPASSRLAPPHDARLALLIDRVEYLSRETGRAEQTVRTLELRRDFLVDELRALTGEASAGPVTSTSSGTEEVAEDPDRRPENRPSRAAITPIRRQDDESSEAVHATRTMRSGWGYAAAAGVLAVVAAVTIVAVATGQSDRGIDTTPTSGVTPAGLPSPRATLPALLPAATPTSLASPTAAIESPTATIEPAPSPVHESDEDGSPEALLGATRARLRELFGVPISRGIGYAEFHGVEATFSPDGYVIALDIRFDELAEPFSDSAEWFDRFRPGDARLIASHWPEPGVLEHQWISREQQQLAAAAELSDELDPALIVERTIFGDRDGRAERLTISFGQRGSR